jgi:hypothetical protein
MTISCLKHEEATEREEVIFGWKPTIFVEKNGKICKKAKEHFNSPWMY